MSKNSNPKNEIFFVVPVEDVTTWYSNFGFIKSLPPLEKVMLTLFYNTPKRCYDFKIIDHQLAYDLEISYKDLNPDLNYIRSSLTKEFKRFRNYYLNSITRYFLANPLLQGKKLKFVKILTPNTLMFKVEVEKTGIEFDYSV